jgi:hypothetical protein
MDNRWKLAGIGAALVATTALATGAITSYLAAPRAEALLPVPGGYPHLAAPGADTAPTPSRTEARPAVRVNQPPVPARAGGVVTSGAPARQAVLRTANCERNDKLIRLGRDGLVGGLVGAAVGAGGGAIADGGKGAGKGAAIGGLAGAAAGSLYGIYENKTACGSAF